MDAKALLEIVQDMSVWKGDVYKLAFAVAEAQKEVAATIAEANGSQEIADAIRGS